MKVFILGLDGLEYDLVEKWNLPNLKQQEYGKIRVPINKKVGVPISPEVWATFLAGKHIQAEFEEPRAPLNPLFKLLRFLREHVNVGLGLSRRIKSNLPMRVHGRYHKGFPELNETTFLDITNSEEINVPYYSYDNLALEFACMLAFGNFSAQEIIKKLNKLYRKRQKQIFKRVKHLRNLDVLFAFLHFPDILQHRLFPCPRLIRQHYNDLDYFVLQLKNKIPQTMLFIIVSDHGFSLQKETHSKHGFYSTNKHLNPKPTRITDFFKIITKLCEKEDLSA